MAVKHVVEYYEKLAVDYHELVSTLEDMQNEGMPQESVDQLETMIATAKDNFERWSCMMYLLNKPINKKKQKKYELQNKNKIATYPNQLEESKNTVSSIKAFKIGG